MLKFFAVGLLLCIVHIDAHRSIKIVITPEDTEPLGDGESGCKLELAECLAQLPITPKSENLKENDGYKEIKGLGSYKVHHTNLPWNEANETCGTEGGHLIYITTAFEAFKVTEMLKNDRESMFWLGDHKVVTSLGEDLGWDYGEGTGFPGILTRSQSTYKQIADIDQCGLLLSKRNVEVAAPCIYPAPFICKREPIKQHDH